MDAGTLTASYFSLSPNQSWVPLAKVLVYCVQQDGEIINDVLDVSFTKILQNHVIIKFTSTCLSDNLHIIKNKQININRLT